MVRPMLNANQRNETVSILDDELKSLRERNQALEAQVKDLAWQCRNGGNGPTMEQVQNANELLRADVRGLHSRVARLERQMHELQRGQA